jgi:endonuclease YncB( thermonuclease family)
MAGVAGGAVAAVVILLGLPAELFGRVPPLTGTMTAPAQQVAVVDGETLKLHETVVRLQGIAAPPRGQACRGQDGAGTDCGAASADALAELVRGHDVACHMNGRDRDGFARATCEAGGTELNRTQVRQGWARTSADSPRYADDEAKAREAHRGVWRESPL